MMMMMMMMVTSQQAKHYEYAKEPNPPNPPSQYQHSINWEFRGIESNLVLWKLHYESVALFNETFHVFPQLGDEYFFDKIRTSESFKLWSHDQPFKGNTGFITRYNQPLDPVKMGTALVREAPATK